MGSAWESAVFRFDGVELAELAKSALVLLDEIVNPIEILLHFMAPAGCDNMFSAELTSFRKRPALVKRGALANLEDEVFGDKDLHFENAEVLLARHLSRVLNTDAVYLYANESYNASGFVRFSSGIATDFEVVGWHGSDTYFSNGACQFDPELRQQLGIVVGRGLGVFEDCVRVEFLDDLFDTFYGFDGVARSFLLMERRQVLAEPREI